MACVRCLYGGLSQQEPTDPTGIMARLRRKAAESDHMVYLGQYDNENNWKAHAVWTGPQILRQLPEINVFCTTVGTGGEPLFLYTSRRHTSWDKVTQADLDLLNQVVWPVPEYT